MNLIDFIQVIENNNTQLKHSSSVALAKSKKSSVSPAQVLYDYVILEISSFYIHAHICKQEGEELPEVPDYWEDLKEFRNAIPGHRDSEKKLDSIKKWMLVHNKIDKISITKIVSDFRDYYTECLKLWGKIPKQKG